MGMILKYANYAHAENECAVSITRQNRFDEGQRRFSTIERWEITGRLQVTDTGVEATNHAAITTALDALQAAYATQGGNLTLYRSDGTTATHHNLTSSNCIGGVRIIDGPSFPVGAGAEYSTFRNYTITAEAEIKVITSGLMAWEETISYQGGGPRYLHLQTLNGYPQKQQVADSTPYRMIQSGSAIGASGYPAFPGPLLPFDEMPDQRQETKTSPRRSGTAGGVVTYSEYAISWSYVHEGIQPANVNPTKWAP